MLKNKARIRFSERTFDKEKAINAFDKILDLYSSHGATQFNDITIHFQPRSNTAPICLFLDDNGTSKKVFDIVCTSNPFSIKALTTKEEYHNVDDCTTSSNESVNQDESIINQNKNPIVNLLRQELVGAEKRLDILLAKIANRNHPLTRKRRLTLANAKRNVTRIKNRLTVVIANAQANFHYKPLILDDVPALNSTNTNTRTKPKTKAQQLMVIRNQHKQLAVDLVISALNLKNSDEVKTVRTITSNRLMYSYGRVIAFSYPELYRVTLNPIDKDHSTRVYLIQFQTRARGAIIYTNNGDLESNGETIQIETDLVITKELISAMADKEIATKAIVLINPTLSHEWNINLDTMEWLKESSEIEKYSKTLAKKHTELFKVVAVPNITTATKKPRIYLISFRAKKIGIIVYQCDCDVK